MADWFRPGGDAVVGARLRCGFSGGCNAPQIEIAAKTHEVRLRGLEGGVSCGPAVQTAPITCEVRLRDSDCWPGLRLPGGIEVSSWWVGWVLRAGIGEPFQHRDVADLYLTGVQADCAVVTEAAEGAGDDFADRADFAGDGVVGFRERE